MAEAGETASAPFEGPEKLLEIWFAPSAAAVPDANSPEDSRTGLRKVPQVIWKEMLAIVKCEVLSVVSGTEIDAYLLRFAAIFLQDSIIDETFPVNRHYLFPPIELFSKPVGPH